MDNSLLAVRDINHKYIVVERRLHMEDYERPEIKVENLSGDGPSTHSAAIGPVMVAGAVYLVVAVFGGAFVYLTATWNNDWASG